MSDPIVPIAPETGVRAAIERAARATGVDFSLLIQTAQRESALNPNARAGTSSATGLFQFIDSTWLDMVRRHGGEFGLGNYAQALQSGGVDAGTRQDILALRSNPELSACMAGALARENATALQTQLGRAPRAGELYAAHVLGAGGAGRLIEAASQGAPNAAALFPREAAANHGIFFTAGQANSAQAVLDRLGLDANATMSAPAGMDRTSAARAGTMSPQLAQALFSLALMPLLQGSDDARDARERDPLQALLAYQRRQS